MNQSSPGSTLKLCSAHYPPEALEAMQAALAPGQTDPESWQHVAEYTLARYLQRDPENVLLCGSGTAALTIAHHFLGCEGKAGVEVPVLTWPSSYSYARNVNLVDTDGHALNPAWSKMKGVVRVPVALWGVDVPGRNLERARELGPVVYDCSHRLGGGLAQLADGLVDAVVYSFGPTKECPCVRGGAIVSGRITPEWRAFRDSGTLGRDAVLPRGGNYEIPEPFAAILTHQLSDPLSTSNPTRNARKHRMTLLSAYRNALDRNDTFLHTTPENASGHLCVVQFQSEDVRNAVRGRLQDANIQTAVHYPLPIHLPYKCFPWALQYSRTVLSLPLHLHMQVEDVHRVVDVVYKK